MNIPERPSMLMTVKFYLHLVVSMVLLFAFFILLRRIPFVRTWMERRKEMELLFEEPLSFRGMVLLFIAFIICFAGATVLMLFRILPEKYTYDFTFAPVYVTGYIWYVMTIIKATEGRRHPRRIVVRFVSVFIFMFLLANAVDFTMIKLGAWDFSEMTCLKAVPLFPPFSPTVAGNHVKVPLVEIFGFNASITWFIHYCLMLLDKVLSR